MADPWRRKALLTGAWLLIFMAMAASFAPTPLYPVYQEMWQLSDLQIAITFAAYPAGVLAILIFFGGVSDRIGRKNTLFISLAFLALALIVLSLAPSWSVLTLGRLLHGFGSGLGTSAGAAALVEAHPRGLQAGSRMNMIAVAGGIAVGPLLSGGLAEITQYPLIFPYLVVTIALLAPLLCLTLAPKHERVNEKGNIVQPIRLPRNLLIPFSVSAASIATANMCMSLFGSFGSQIAESGGWVSQVSTGWFVSVVLILMAVAQLIGGRFRHTTAMRMGTLGASVGLGVLAFGSTTGSALLLILGAVLVGLMGGFSLLGSAGYIAEISPPARRAEIYSVYLLVAFSTLALVALGAGPVMTRTSIGVVLAIATSFTALGALWVSIQASRTARSN